MDSVISTPSSAFDRPFEAAVVIPTVVRPSLLQAVRGVFDQAFDGRIQILIGVDKVDGDPSILSQLQDECPDHCALTVVNPGYSTSARNGGLYSAWDGGGLRAILTFLAHSERVAYLDDDNWWHEEHLASLSSAIEGQDWAYSLRWLVDETDDRVVCIDKWHSVGPGRGLFKESLGGFADPSSMMIDKVSCTPALPLWCFGTGQKNDTADRRFCRFLCQHRKARGTERPTLFYRMRKTNRLWRIIKAGKPETNRKGAVAGV